jgi:hypothetical protein
VIRRIFSRKAPDAASTTAIPVEVATAIAAASVILRPSSERVLVQMHGLGLFEYDDEHALAFFKNAFPELNSDQIARAARMLAGHVSVHARLQAQLHANVPGGTTWSKWRPLRMENA